MTSHDLLTKWVRERDEVAFRDLVKLHAPMVFATSKRILGDAAEAEDVTQECFETLALTCRQPRGHLGAWLHRVATNRCIDRLRSTQRRADREKSFADRKSSLAADWNDIYDQVDAAIAALPHAQREPLVAYFLQGRSHADIANELHLSRQAVTRRIQRALEGVRKHLHRRGVPVPAATLSALLVQHTHASALSTTLSASLGKLALAAPVYATLGSAGIAGALGIAKLVTAVSIVLAVIASTAYIAANSDPGSSIDPPLTMDDRGPDDAAIPADPVPAEPQRSGASPPESETVQASADPTPDELGVSNPATDAPAPSLDPPGASVSGIVLRADGKVFAGAHVILQEIVPGGGFAGASGSDGPLTDGTFKIYGLKEGDYSARVIGPGNIVNGAAFEVSRIHLNTDEHLTGTRLVYGTEGNLTITGIVADRNRRPHAGANLVVYGPVQRTAVTDERGQFTIEFLPEGGYQLHASPKSGSQYEFADGHSGAMAGDKNVSIVLPRNGTLTGKVVHADTREPLKNFQASFSIGHAREFRADLMGNAKEFSDPNGEFRLEWVTPGEVTIAVSADGYAPGFIHSTVEEGGTVENLVITLSPGSTLHGRVVDSEGLPLIGARIFQSSIEKEAWIRGKTPEAVTDDTGAFHLDNVSPELKVISAYHEGFAPASAVANDGVLITLQKPATLKVTMTDAKKPLPDAWVHVSFRPELRPGYVDSAQSDPEGEATVTNVPPGLALVQASYPNATNKRTLHKYVQLDADGETAVSFDFSPQDSGIEGAVFSQGAPVALAMVYLQLESDTGPEIHQTFTNKEGGFWFDHLASGSAILKVEIIDNVGNTIRSVFRHVQMDPGQVTQQIVTLSNASRLEGRVVGLDGSEIGLVSVLLGSHTLEDLSKKSPFGIFGSFEQLGNSGCDQDGSFHLDNLEPGEYTVVAQSFPRNDWESLHPLAVAHVTVRDGETATADFEYRRPNNP